MVLAVDSLICIKYLDWLQKQQVIDKIVYRKKVLEDTLRKIIWNSTVVNGEMMIDKRANEVLGPEVDYTRSKKILS